MAIPQVVYNGEREAELLKKLCEIDPVTENRMNNIKLTPPVGILIIEKEYNDSWVAVNRVYHGWNVVKTV